MSKALFDFGVVTFDSDYNSDYNRFHVRVEIEYDASRVMMSCSSNPTDRVIFNNIRAEISKNGKRIEYGNCLDTILKHSELRKNGKFLKFYNLYKNHATLMGADAKEFLRQCG